MTRRLSFPLMGIVGGLGAILWALILFRPLQAQTDTTRFANANSWPLDDAYRGITTYPDTEWTWALLGLNEGFRCPGYYRREFEDSLNSWRDPALPEDQDWKQATRGTRLVACYRFHAGTDISAPPGAAVYAAAAGTILEVRHGLDEEGGEDSAITIAHRRVLDGLLYEWTVRYLHLNEDLVRESGEVIEGEVIGFLADRGGNTHLHFEIAEWDGCAAPCITNPWGPLYLWVDDDFDSFPDPAPAYLPLPERGEDLLEGVRLDSGAAYLPYALEAGTSFRLDLSLDHTGRTFALAEITLRGLNSADALVCTLVIPPGGRSYRLGGETASRWENPHLKVEAVQGVTLTEMSLQRRAALPSMDLAGRCRLPAIPTP